MKALKWIGIIVVILGITGYFGMDYAKAQTKKHSPQDTISYKSGNLTLGAVYCSPSKKGREIFGGLVPLNEVWRTGANEPTTFTTNKRIKFGTEYVEAGTYSLWTIPQSSQWTVILNSEIPGWGVDFSSKPSRNPEFDVIKINAAVHDVPEALEHFTMAFEYNVNLSFAWDKTKVTVPIEFSNFD